MINTENIFIKILSAYVNNDDFEIYDFDCDELMHLADIHSVSGIVAAVLLKKEDKLSKEFATRLKNILVATTVRGVKQEIETNKIIKILNENKIWHLLTKGYIVKNYYRDRELRTMGDTDFLIKKEDFNTAVEILKKDDYKITDSYFDEVSFDKNNTHFEFHTNLLNENLGNNICYGEYFEDVCNKKAECISKYSFKLGINDHLIYLLAHIGKHFYNEGCGIRMILDIAVYLKHFEKEIDFDYVNKELDKIMLSKFSNNIFYLCKYWFESKVECKKISCDLFLQIQKYILEAGVFGFYNRNIGIKLRRNGYGQNEKILNWFFPSSEDMKQLCLWYKDKSVILLPLAWIFRIVNAVITKKKEVVLKACGIVYGRKEAIKQKKLLKELGIYQNMNDR